MYFVVHVYEDSFRSKLIAWVLCQRRSHLIFCLLQVNKDEKKKGKTKVEEGMFNDAIILQNLHAKVRTLHAIQVNSLFGMQSIFNISVLLVPNIFRVHKGIAEL